jgi:uncharacterized protein with PQ loop repeat
MAQHHHLIHFQLNRKQAVTNYDRAMLGAAFIYPFTGVPQALEVLQGNTEGVSLLSWVGFTFFGTIFLIYSIMHRLKPMIITYTMWLLLDVSIVIGILLNNG